MVGIWAAGLGKSLMRGRAAKPSAAHMHFASPRFGETRQGGVDVLCNHYGTADTHSPLLCEGCLGCVMGHWKGSRQRGCGAARPVKEIPNLEPLSLSRLFQSRLGVCVCHL